MDTFRGYKIKGKKGLSHWDKLLEEWLQAVERYSRITKGDDAPYFFNERANVGVLASASWRSGCIALEEYQSQKGHKNKKKKYGRVDLWLASESHEEIIEAKYKWICMNSGNASKMVKKTMGTALEDVKKARANTDVKSIGVGFFPVYKSNNKVEDRGGVDNLVDSTIKEFLTFDYHALAWCFPKETRLHISNTGYVLPGLFLFAKNLDY